MCVYTRPDTPCTSIYHIIHQYLLSQGEAGLPNLTTGSQELPDLTDSKDKTKAGTSHPHLNQVFLSREDCCGTATESKAKPLFYLLGFWVRPCCPHEFKLRCTYRQIRKTSTKTNHNRIMTTEANFYMLVNRPSCLSVTVSLISCVLINKALCYGNMHYWRLVCRNTHKVVLLRYFWSQ